MRRHFVIGFILLSVLAFQCENDNKSDCKNAICTMEFRGISVLIKHSTDSSAVLLTSYKVIRVSDNVDITINDNILDDNRGYYPLVNDNYVTMLSNRDVEIEFQGYIGNILSIKTRFIVTADCCHVSLVSGQSVFYI
jgi:hypothetical protein